MKNAFVFTNIFNIAFVFIMYYIILKYVNYSSIASSFNLQL